MSKKMREILFRGKSLDKSGAWVLGSLIHRTDFYGDPCDDYFILYGGEFDCDYYDADRVNPETVGQFTGLFDKNGTKIFEGDIVKIKDFSAGCYLTCEQPTSNFAVKWYGKEGRFGIDYMKLFPYDFTKSEVIGNIHDNPELLKRK